MDSGFLQVCKIKCTLATKFFLPLLNVSKNTL